MTQNSSQKRASSRYAQSNKKSKFKGTRQAKPFRGKKSGGKVIFLDGAAQDNPRRSRGGSRRRHSGGGGRSGGRKMGTFDPSMFINENPVEEKQEVYEATHTFKDFNLDSRILETLDNMGILIPSPIQDQIIPEMLAGKDVIGIAETGTGKTAAFLLPIIEKTLQEYTRQTLILTPTRELAIQIEQELWKLSNGHRISSVTCVGGVSKRPQVIKLKRKNHFIIGTPGRVLDLIQSGELKTEKTTTLVLDEADRMLDMGFIGDIEKIIDSLPKERETHFFSATFDNRTKSLTSKFMKDPVTVSVKKTDASKSVKQRVVHYNHSNKYGTLLSLLNSEECTRAIVFGAMKHSVSELARDLKKHDINAESLHGNKTHRERQKALKAFKDNKAKVLVATDVAARGIHVDDVSHVINYDLPQTQDDYIHRIGRTGRGVKKGEAITFVKE